MVKLRNKPHSPKSKQILVAIFRKPGAIGSEQGPATFERFVWGVALLQVMHSVIRWQVLH